MTYNYEMNVKADVKEWIMDNMTEESIKEYGCRYDLEEYLQDTLWAEDSVTGNSSGSYTFSTYEAEENLCHNLDLLGEALREFGCGPEYLMEKGPEACDVTIRCYLLNQAIGEALDEMGYDDIYFMD